MSVSLDRGEIKTKLKTIFMKTFGFGTPEGNLVSCPGSFRNKRVIEKYLAQCHSFRTHWHNKLFETIIVDEMAQKVDAV